MLQYGRNFKPLSRVRHKRPHIVLLHLQEVSRISKSIAIESRLVVARSWEEGGIGSDFLGDGNFLELDSGDGCTKW